MAPQAYDVYAEIGIAGLALNSSPTRCI
jgi:hypothetical protein